MKLKKKQQKKWSIFFKYALEVYKEKKLIALPFGKSGYGFVGNPFNLTVNQKYGDLFGEKIFDNLIFFVKSLDYAKILGNFSEKAIKIVKHLWPG